MTARTALVVGATGLVGGFVVERLLERDDYDRVVVLARRPLERADAKLAVRVVDFEHLASGEAEAAIELGGAIDRVDDVYAALGTTIKVAGTRERFRRVDHDYTVAVARLARAAGARRLGFVSSVGAGERASTFYLRVKGETERALRELAFETLVVARPSLLLGERAGHRRGEAAARAVAPVVSRVLLGGLAKYRPIAARDVGRAIVDALASGATGERVLEHRELVALASGVNPRA